MSRIEQAFLRSNQAALHQVPPQADDDTGADPAGNVRPFADPARAARPQEVTPAISVPQAAVEPPAAPAPETVEFAGDEKLVRSPTTTPLAAEQYRRLAATLHRMQTERGSKVLMVSSAIAGEGKTLTAANLALTLAESFGRRVLLIDADLRRPALHQVFGVANTGGLNDGLRAAEEAKLALVKLSALLTLLPAGSANPDPMSVLTSARMRHIIENAAATFDWVVIDTPPIGLLPDANLLAEMADLVVFVVAAGRTPCEVVQRAVSAMDKSRVVGVVLNGVAPSRSMRQYDEYMEARG